MTLSRMPITSDPERMGGKVCIGETRMPVAELLIHLAQGGSLGISDNRTSPRSKARPAKFDPPVKSFRMSRQTA